jgi:hypothetical protein
MAQFEPVKSELEQAGTQAVLIAAEKRDGMFKPAKFLEKHPVSFPFLLDADRTPMEKVTEAVRKLAASG